MITGSPSLRVLDVSQNDIGDDGIFSCLQHIDTLTELNIAGCELSIKGRGSQLASVYCIVHSVIY